MKEVLIKYLPKASVPLVMDLIMKNNIHLKITKQRRSKLGDYRPPGKDNPNHRITINHNLNRYSFLLTFIHEVAHLQIWNEHANKVSPHGKEWKLKFKELIIPFLQEEIFPADLLDVLHRSNNNFKASTGSDLKLMRALKKYDVDGENQLHLEELKEGDFFETTSGKIFQKGTKRRTRYICINKDENRPYLFHPLTPVKKLQA